MTPAPHAGLRLTAAALAVGVWAGALVGCGAAPSVPGTAGADPITGAGEAGVASPARDLGGYADELFRLTNEVRAAEGLPALDRSDCAERSAVERATRLLGGAALQHAPMDDVLADCAPSTEAAENLVRADAGADEVIDAWLGSPGHRANLLSESVSALGVGCVRDGSPLLCAQIFLGP